MPDEREAAGSSRCCWSTTRAGPPAPPRTGLLLLEEQDRTAWDRRRSRRGICWSSSPCAAGPGRFALQAAIAALHAQAPSTRRPTGPGLVLYDALLRVWPSPVVALNRAVAVAMVEGPAAALAEIEALEQDAGSPATTTCRRSRRTCCAGWTARGGRAGPTERRWTCDNEAERAFLAERVRETSTQPSR